MRNANHLIGSGCIAALEAEKFIVESEDVDTEQEAKKANPVL
jgi:hypothetical protein